MKRLFKVLVFMLVLVMLVCSCGKNKGAAEEQVNTKEKIEESSSNEAEAHDHGYEMAMSAYQCPMKCEGDRRYEEEGVCPECNMDLKKVELKEEEVTGDETAKE